VAKNVRAFRRFSPRLAGRPGGRQVDDGNEGMRARAVAWIPGAESGDPPPPAADQSMHFVENLPAGMGFSALCGWCLRRVENRLADLQFSTICMRSPAVDGHVPRAG
jgi:hypothetical protein